MTDDRATSTVVGKALEAALVVLFIGLLASTLYGSVVPNYRTAAATEIGERVLAKSAQRIQQAVPANASTVEAHQQVELPRTIERRAYRIRANGTVLTLDHPDRAVSQSVRLALPDTVVRVEGTWTSREPASLDVQSVPGGLLVRLESGDR